MAAHTRKKQFQSSSQSSIRSYFERVSSDQENVFSKSQPARSPLSPPVPDHVQLNLINVGMRVRKSVPEGYKTHKTMPEEIYRPQRPPPPSSAPASFVRQKELQPFCGLHTVGGLATQSHSQDILPPPLTYSQETAPSTTSSFASMTATAGPSLSTKKRSYDDEIEEELDAFFDEEVPQAVEPTPRSIAKPRGRVKTSPTGTLGFVKSDFDDYDVGFLQPMETD